MKQGFEKIPYVVCELANSHGGDEAVIRELIEQFGLLDYPKKGIKFQVFRADTIALRDFQWYPVYEELQLSHEDWSKLINQAANLGDVWIDVFDIFSIDVIRENIAKIAGVKLQASVLDNQEVVSGLMSLGLSEKTLIINVSGFGLDDIARFVSVFDKFSEKLVLQIGFQAYPTAVSDTALQKIGVLKAAFPNLPLGLADHADATTEFATLAPAYASLLGCSYIEKHFCLDRKAAKYDGFSALEPDEMQRLCDRLKEAAQAQDGYFVGVSEKSYLDKSVQIPILRSEMRAGDLIGLSDLLFRRTSQNGATWAQIAQRQRSRMVVKTPLVAGRTIDPDQFKKARVAAIVAGRMKSSRLPGKAILPIAGVASVERCLNQCLAVTGLDRVILATSTVTEDSILEGYLCDGKVSLWRGDPEDVIARYLGACEHFGIDVVVRVTADCPLVLPEIVDHLIEKHFETGADYTAAARSAVGTSAEIINVSALKRVVEYFSQAPYSEYMTWYFQNNSDVFKVNNVELPESLVRAYRMTLDYPEDLRMFEAVFGFLKAGQSAFSANEVFSVMDQHPDIPALNSHLELKYVTDKSLIEMLNEKTRILQ